MSINISRCILRGCSKLSNEIKIEALKQQLNKLVNADDNAKLSEGEILYLSQKLDKLIVDCYNNTKYIAFE